MIPNPTPGAAAAATYSRSMMDKFHEIGLSFVVRRDFPNGFNHFPYMSPLPGLFFVWGGYVSRGFPHPSGVLSPPATNKAHLRCLVIALFRMLYFHMGTQHRRDKSPGVVKRRNGFSVPQFLHDFIFLYFRFIIYISAK
jgi:hypothetical protein